MKADALERLERVEALVRGQDLDVFADELAAIRAELGGEQCQANDKSGLQVGIDVPPPAAPIVCSSCGKAMPTDEVMWTGYIAVGVCDHIRSDEGEQVEVSEASQGTSLGSVDGRDSDVSSMPPVGQVPPAVPCDVCGAVKSHPCHNDTTPFTLTMWNNHMYHPVAPILREGASTRTKEEIREAVRKVKAARPKCVVCGSSTDHPCHQEMPEFGSIWSHHPFAWMQ